MNFSDLPQEDYLKDDKSVDDFSPTSIDLLNAIVSDEILNNGG